MCDVVVGRCGNYKYAIPVISEPLIIFTCCFFVLTCSLWVDVASQPHSCGGIYSKERDAAEADARKGGHRLRVGKPMIVRTGQRMLNLVADLSKHVKEAGSMRGQAVDNCYTPVLTWSAQESWTARTQRICGKGVCVCVYLLFREAAVNMKCEVGF